MGKKKSVLSEEDIMELITVLKSRFEKNMDRHKDFQWADVEKAILENPEYLSSLHSMEVTGGEPDLVDFKNPKSLMFCDCSAESPTGRRSLCYDRCALESRKKFKPENDASSMASEMGVTILNEDQYRYLQEFGVFDQKTSSWLQTPRDVRQLGGALFADFRYGRVFVYHNGAESYYAARGFRAVLEIKFAY